MAAEIGDMLLTNILGIIPTMQPCMAMKGCVDEYAPVSNLIFNMETIR